MRDLALSVILKYFSLILCTALLDGVTFPAREEQLLKEPAILLEYSSFSWGQHNSFFACVAVFEAVLVSITQEDTGRDEPLCLPGVLSASHCLNVV